MTSSPAPVARDAARVLLVDPDERVLLVRGGDPARPAAGTWWFTPGGGLEPGEDARTAAVREAFEETGLRLSGLVGPVAHRSSVFSFEGRLIEQRERFFLARVTMFEPSSAGWTALERRVLSGFRWWTVPELRATAETVYPETLAAMLDEALRSADPTTAPS